MERTREPVLIVAHQGILRILYAYFMGLDRKDAPYVSIPLNNVIELKPHAYGCHEQRFCLMHKEEMENDGQDEPVTSMPVNAGSMMNQHGNGETTTTTGGTSDYNITTRTINVNYEHNDPIMNAPSC
mmetsp:Transcript_1900/g.2573  ORF Transcript_1900/g.2573 Transcript_1900/m.2573 type:complete len:127 (-) Transcript_1900:171-551(-)